jgi:hypothetical protein
MSLITSRGITAGSKRQMSESDWTKLLLERGYAELGESEQRLRPANKTAEVKPVDVHTPLDKAPIPDQTRPAPTPERRRALRDMAEAITRRKR